MLNLLKRREKSMGDTDTKRAKAAAALETYVEVADHLREKRAAVTYASACMELRKERAQERATEKALLEKQLREAESKVNEADAEQAKLSEQMADAKMQGDTEALHKLQMKSQAVVWQKQEANRAQGSIIGKLAQFPSGDGWYGSKSDLWRAWRSIDFGPDHQKIFDLLTTGEWADLRDDVPLSLRYTIADGQVVDYAPKAKK